MVIQTMMKKPELISCLTDLGYSYDGLQTGYPGGEPDWHYVKDLSGLTPETLRKSFVKKVAHLLTRQIHLELKCAN